jgi:hypothetical protein
LLPGGFVAALLAKGGLGVLVSIVGGVVVALLYVMLALNNLRSGHSDRQ